MSQGSALEVVRRGSGPEILLVHGGASPHRTWRALDRLEHRYTLATVYRRGFPPSPDTAAGGQDFEVDADDIVELLSGRPHVVAHSYGGVGAMLAATREPQSVRSLTLLEAPFDLPGDAGVARLKQISQDVLAHGTAADPEVLREFLSIAGAHDVGDGPVPDGAVRGLDHAQGSRSPYDAELDTDALRRSGIPILVASGAHSAVLERIGDALAAAVGARRIRVPGAGHFIADAPGFPDRLVEFLESVDATVSRVAPAS